MLSLFWTITLVFIPLSSWEGGETTTPEAHSCGLKCTAACCPHSPKLTVCISSNSTFRDTTLPNWNQPSWEYLHQGNRQVLQIKAFFFKEPLYKHTTKYFSWVFTDGWWSYFYILEAAYKSDEIVLEAQPLEHGDKCFCSTVLHVTQECVFEGGGMGTKKPNMKLKWSLELGAFNQRMLRWTGEKKWADTCKNLDVFF